MCRTNKRTSIRIKKSVSDEDCGDEKHLGPIYGEIEKGRLSSKLAPTRDRSKSIEHFMRMSDRVGSIKIKAL